MLNSPLKAGTQSPVRSPIGIIGSSGAPQPAQFITNGAFAADTNWTKGAGWTIAAGAATSDGSGGALSQNFGALTAALISGQNYTLSFDLITNPSLNSFRVSVTDGVGTQNITTVTTTGSKSVGFTANANHHTIILIDLDGLDTTQVDNVSIVPA